MLKNIFAMCVWGLSASVWAQWQADEVDVSFLTTKITNGMDTVTEINTFDKATATLNFDGKLNAVIDLDSVNTGIGIRDQRLRDHIFAKAKDHQLLVSGNVDLRDIDRLAVGQSLILHQPLRLTFGGQEMDVTSDLLIVRQAADLISVTTLKPIMLDLTLFDIRNEMKKLAQLAGLNQITLQLPVLLHTQFTRIGD